MRSLVVTDTFPWPISSGNAMRLVNVLTALAALGPVDLFAMVEAGRGDACELPANSPVARSLAVPRPPVGALRRAGGWVHQRLPLAMAGRDDADARRRLAIWAPDPYDLVWYQRPAAWTAVQDQITAPSIVDLDDMEDDKVLARVALRDRSRRPDKWLRRRFQIEDARRWARVQSRVAASVDGVCVCTADDDRHWPTTMVVPNAYEPPDHPLGRTAVGQPPTFLFPGMLTYPPNTDAAVQLVEHVGPRLRELVPHAQIRLVGRADARIEAMASPPEVVVTGWVPEMEPELAKADVVVVPIRYGGGTRIKIIEAFAHRIPVAATRAAAAGLGVRSGEHLLLAESADELAAACARLVGDLALRTKLADQAYAHYLANFTAEAVRAQIRAAAAKVISPR